MPPADDAYQAILERLFAARRFGVDLSLDRIAAVLARLGDPHAAIERRVAVAGTNGKGSTAAFVASIAAAAGVRAGVFTSPHLSRFAERFRIAGELASETSIAAASRAVTRAAVDDGGGELTFFEQCTAIAALLFAGAGVELGIFEVGLGGRLDATRALGCELVIITGVSYDHCDVLGDRLEQIAAEKAGAVAPGGTAIIGAGGEPESPALLVAAARAAGAGRVVEVTAADRDAVPESLGLAGAHQRDNAAAALVAARELGFATEVDRGAVVAGLATAQIAGRLERFALEGGVVVVLDGAHNADGARALARWLAASPEPTAAVVAISRGRNPLEILEPLAGQLDAVIACAVAGDRGIDPAEVAAAARRALPEVDVETAPGVPEAVVVAAARSRRVVVFGSLYAVAEARRHLTREPADPVAVSDPLTAR